MKRTKYTARFKFDRVIESIQKNSLSEVARPYGLGVNLLSNFPQLVDEVILKRGEKYYRQGAVLDLIETDQGWEATVAGTDEYQVEILNLTSGLEMICDCPYDYGPVCKHQVAVLHALNQGLKTKSLKKRKNGKRINRQENFQQQADKILAKLSLEQSQDILREILSNDEFLLGHFVSSHSQEVMDKGFYKSQLESDLNLPQEWGKFMSYDMNGMIEVEIPSAVDLLQQTQQWIEQGHGSKAIPALQAVIEVLPLALDQALGATGEIEDSVEQGFSLLHLAIEAGLADTEQQRLFKYCLVKATEKIYADWGWQFEFLRLAVELVTTKQQEQELTQLLDDFPFSNESDSERWRAMQFEKIIEIKAQLLLNRHSQNYEQFLRDHQEVEAMRENLILWLISQSKYQEARVECERVLSQAPIRDEETYLQLLLTIVRSQGDKPSELEVVRRLLIKTGSLDYYHQLKALISPDEWEDYREELLQVQRERIMAEDGWQGLYFGNSTLAQIYELEDMWAELIDLVVSSNSLHLANNYRFELEQRYPQEMAEFYQKMILTELTEVGKREKYQEQCRYIRRIKKMGFLTQAQGIIAELRQQYSRRSALMEELDRV